MLERSALIEQSVVYLSVNHEHGSKQGLSNALTRFIVNPFGRLQRPSITHHGCAIIPQFFDCIHVVEVTPAEFLLLSNLGFLEAVSSIHKGAHVTHLGQE